MLPLTSFYPAKRGLMGRAADCRECQASSKRTRYVADPSVRRRKQSAALKHKYGITLDQRDALRRSQGNACGICREPLTGGQAEHIDHCHDTGRVRGVLCSRCNMGIGLLKDDPAILLRAVAYLTQQENPNVEE